MRKEDRVDGVCDDLVYARDEAVFNVIPFLDTGKDIEISYVFETRTAVRLTRRSKMKEQL